MPRRYFRTCLGTVAIQSFLPGMSYGACLYYLKKVLSHSILGLELLLFAGHRYILDFIPSSVQKVPPRGVSFHGEYRISITTHVFLYRVTSHVKAMEDAVEIGLRAAFNDVEFTSFGEVLPGLKLKGERLSACKPRIEPG